MKDSVDIRVEKDGVAEEFTDVSPPNTVKANVVNYSASEDLYDATDPTFSSTSLIGSDLYIYDISDLLTNISFASQPVTANFSSTPESALTGQTVTFDASNSFSLNSSLTAYQWDFGDGTQSGQMTSPVTTHSYSRSGTYTATLTVTNSNGNQDTFTQTIQVNNAAPDASFTASTLQPTVGQPVVLDAAGSTDREGAIANYEWDVDNDGAVEMTGPTVNHVFTSTGTQEVSLRVIDDQGNTDTFTQRLTATEPNDVPQPTFSVGSSPTAGSSVTFDAKGSTDPDGSIQTYYWDFGDGARANGEQVSHTFRRGGTYDVTLTVADDQGAIASVNQTIQVTGSQEDDSTAETTRASGPGFGTVSAVVSILLGLFWVSRRWS